MITSHEVAIKNVVQQNKKFTRMIQISLTQAPKRCWHLPFRDNLTSNFTYVPYAAKQGAFISADQSIMHDSCKIGTSKTARLTNDYSVEGQLIVHQVKWWKQSRVLYPYESSYFIFVLRWLLMQHHLERKKIQRQELYQRERVKYFNCICWLERSAHWKGKSNSEACLKNNTKNNSDNI